MAQLAWVPTWQNALCQPAQARLRELLQHPERVRALQEGLLHHQKYFLWEPDIQGGVLNNIERELAMRSAQRAGGETVSVF